MDEAGAADVDAAGEEGHAERFVVGDSLEGADYVGTFEVLAKVCVTSELLLHRGMHGR